MAFQATAGFLVQAVDSLERVCYNGKGLGRNNSGYLLLCGTPESY